MRVRINKKIGVALTLGLAASASFANLVKVAQTTAAPGACGDWSGYRAFVERFVQADGRVIDYSTPTQQTTSEGQSYALFFALVANDRATFDRLLGWTRTNLAGNQFDAQNMRLPSWQWGRKAGRLVRRARSEFRFRLRLVDRLRSAASRPPVA